MQHHKTIYQSDNEVCNAILRMRGSVETNLIIDLCYHILTGTMLYYTYNVIVPS